MSTGNAVAAGACTGPICYAAAAAAALAVGGAVLIAFTLPTPDQPPLPPIVLRCRELLDGIRRAAPRSHHRFQLASDALAEADHAIAVGCLHEPLLHVGVRARRPGPAPPRAQRALDAALQPRLAVAGRLPPLERGDALVKRAEINLDYYHRCIFPCPARLGRATADLREALCVRPDNARARAMLGECLMKKGGYKKKDLAPYLLTQEL
uniref:Uncharacterized protein n=1 Tax=Oryza punctata TaxID=4537 RepID=A0A0E0JX28_ORYPU